MWRWMGSVATALALTGTTPAIAATSCGFDGAGYEMAGGKFHLQMSVVPGTPSSRRVQLLVTSKDTRRTYGFYVNRGNGYGEATLNPINGASVEIIEIYTVADDETFDDFFGSLDARAPKRVFIPKLGPALWHQADALSGEKTAGQVREQMPRAFFDRVSCGAVRP